MRADSLVGLSLSGSNVVVLPGVDVVGEVVEAGGAGGAHAEDVAREDVVDHNVRAAKVAGRDPLEGGGSEQTHGHGEGQEDALNAHGGTSSASD